MKVVVVGAGLSGLVAADRLARQGVSVIVLEARGRVGGRMHGIEVAAGCWVDAGAAFLGDKHTDLLDVMAELDLKTTPTSMVGDSRFELGHGDQTQPGRFPPLSAVALGDMFDQLDELTEQIDLNAPWLIPNASDWDTMTAAQWAAENLRHPDARLFFELFLGEMMAADPDDVSVLHMALYLTSGGGVRYLNAFEGGAQESRVDGGAHQICERLAQRLHVRRNQPVEAIRTGADGVSLRTATDTYHADAAIVAIPPVLAQSITFEPALPTPRGTAATAPGCAVKVQLVYPQPSWRAHGLSGWSVSAHGPMVSTVDDSPPAAGVGVLTGFITGSEAHRFAALPEGRQREVVTAQAARLFPQLPAPQGVHITDWVNERYSRGCYAALFGPGDWLRLGPNLTTPHGRIHWAGTETSTEFFGLMEGAIRAGHRAANEILADI